MKRAARPALLLRKIVQKLGLHPDDRDHVEVDLSGHRALVVATNHSMLDIGKPTGVFASELTSAYYAFSDAGMDVDVAGEEAAGAAERDLRFHRVVEILVGNDIQVIGHAYPQCIR